MLSAEDFTAAGLYDSSLHAGTERFELLEWLESLGFTIAQMQAADEQGALSSLAGDSRVMPGSRLSRDEAIEMSGLDAASFDAFVTGLGFVGMSPASAEKIGFTVDEVTAIVVLGSISPMFSFGEVMGFARVLGSSLGRIGEAAVSLFLTDVEGPHLDAGESEFGLAKKVYEAVGMLDELSRQLDPILRRQVMQATERTREAIEGNERRLMRFAVGFVDLVGFTERAVAMTAIDLTNFVREFEGRAHDVMTQNGARVVKLIGDEVMFIATDPDAACRAAGALMKGFDEVGDRVLPRGGLAYGEVLVRGGDYYGSVVNLASRLVNEAVPQEVLVTDDLATAATSCTFEPAGRRVVKGFPDPISVHSLVVSEPSS